MTKLFGGRIASAVVGLFMLLGAVPAAAEDLSALRDVSAAVRALDTNTTSNAIGTIARPAADLIKPAVLATTSAPIQSTAAMPSSTGGPSAAMINAIRAAQPTVAKVATSIEREAAWLYKGGWPLYALVDKYSAGAPLDEQANCLATAVYFEARGESLEGQLAVARVVMNRAASGRYPPDWCSVVKQPWQFSFVRSGQFPAVDPGSSAWARAQAIARLAAANIVPSVESDVLWYHATYVAPSWGRRLSRVERIGAHIFYRA